MIFDHVAAADFGRWAKRWGVAGLVALACATVLQPRTSSVRRVAIEVDCTAPDVCELAESLALDVWSEQRGPGLPLAVVVASDALARLDAAHVAWHVIDPDIDATAWAE